MDEKFEALLEFARSYYPHNCFYCGVKLNKKHRRGKHSRIPEGAVQRTMDHVIPRSKGGSRYFKVPCCEPCNREKSDMDYEDFRSLRGGVEFHGETKWKENVARSKPWPTAVTN